MTAAVVGERHLEHLDPELFDQIARFCQMPPREGQPTLLRGVIKNPQGFFGEAHIEQMMRNPWLVERMGLFRDTKQVPPPGMDHTEVSKRLQSPYTADFVAQELAKGDVSLLLRALQRVPGAVHDLCVALAATGWPTAIASGFETPPSRQALATHWDATSLAVLQMAGAKRWLIWRPAAGADSFEAWSACNGGSDYTDDERAVMTPSHAHTDVVLHPGDVLLLPVGWSHAPVAIGDRSLHVSVSPLSREVYDGCGGDENHKLDLL
jgi:hypothetical protein